MLRKLFYWMSSISPTIATLLSKLKHQSRFAGKPELTAYGFLFSGSRNMINGKFEKDESMFFMDIAKNYEGFINIGANVGYYVAMAQHKGFRQIYAFEPNVSNFEVLQSNARLSYHKHTVLENVAVGDKEDTLKLYGDTTGASLVPGWSGTSSKVFNEVKVITLDKYFDENKLPSGPILVLIDVEGFEFFVLKGMIGLLERNDMALIIEICYQEHWESVNPYFEQTFVFLKNLGYNCYSVHSSKHDVIASYNQFLDYAKTNTNHHNYFFSKTSCESLKFDNV